jgi:hypothetical protein
LPVDLTTPTEADTKLEASVVVAIKTGMKMIEQRVSVETGISKTLKSALEAGLQEAMEKLRENSRIPAKAAADLRTAEDQRTQRNANMEEFPEGLENFTGILILEFRNGSQLNLRCNRKIFDLFEYL